MNNSDKAFYVWFDAHVDECLRKNITSNSTRVKMAWKDGEAHGRVATLSEVREAIIGEIERAPAQHYDHVPAEIALDDLARALNINLDE